MFKTTTFLVDELIKAAAVLPVKMYITSPERHYVETFKVGNYDHCEVTLGTTIHRIDIGKDGKKNVVYAKGVILWRPDRWYDAYPLWFRYGKENLERMASTPAAESTEKTSGDSEPSVTIKLARLNAFQRKQAEEKAAQRAKEEAFVEAELPKYSPGVKRTDIEELKDKLRELYQAQSQGQWASARRIMSDLPQPIYDNESRPSKKPDDMLSAIQNALMSGESDNT